jgi:hypothetical protein
VKKKRMMTTILSSLSTSGYKTNMPKWEKAEKELINKGITPETLGWIERANE